MALVLACSRQASNVTVHYQNGEDAFSSGARHVIQENAETTFREVRRALPQLPPTLIIEVSAGSNVIPETGETGYTSAPNVLSWVVDTRRAEGVVAIANRELRGTMFHELHHLGRDRVIARVTLMDQVVSEGLATAFERDFAHVKVPWGEYPPEARAWALELRALPSDAPVGKWLYETHADGRRWIGLKAGTYLAGRAIASTGRSAADLVAMPTADVLSAALK
ncbi:MAG: hypothetical protein HOO96_42840 [Polyangiaceae bacterium]|nr:hypothetical protein [Polyangiaceae bacterium]